MDLWERVGEAAGSSFLEHDYALVFADVSSELDGSVQWALWRYVGEALQVFEDQITDNQLREVMQAAVGQGVDLLSLDVQRGSAVPRMAIRVVAPRGSEGKGASVAVDLPAGPERGRIVLKTALASQAQHTSEETVFELLAEGAERLVSIHVQGSMVLVVGAEGEQWVAVKSTRQSEMCVTYSWAQESAWLTLRVNGIDRAFDLPTAAPRELVLQGVVLEDVQRENSMDVVQIIWEGAYPVMSMDPSDPNAV